MRHAHIILATASLLATAFAGSSEAGTRIKLLAPGSLVSLNPQPLPPKERVMINPQPLPPRW